MKARIAYNSNLKRPRQLLKKAVAVPREPECAIDLLNTAIRRFNYQD
jgi:hypothetical protein